MDVHASGFRSLPRAATLSSTYTESYLKVISKLLERLVASQLSDNKLLPDHQSAYRAFCSTETVIARVLSDILTAIDSGDIAALCLLDLSAAFDTVDHSILLRRQQRSYGLNGSALAWFGSYLNQRQQHVTHRGVESVTTTTQFGVPQGSVSLHSRRSAPGTAAWSQCASVR